MTSDESKGIMCLCERQRTCCLATGKGAKEMEFRVPGKILNQMTSIIDR